jgi:hypothetical protein
VGLILGPRGNSLEAIKNRHQTQVSIRGRGSLKDGMTGVTKDGKIIDHLDEDMHCHITGPSVEQVKACAKEIEELIEMQIYNPDCEKVREETKPFPSTEKNLSSQFWLLIWLISAPDLVYFVYQQ